jgi:hypothetical protein
MSLFMLKFRSKPENLLRYRFKKDSNDFYIPLPVLLSERRAQLPVKAAYCLKIDTESEMSITKKLTRSKKSIVHKLSKEAVSKTLNRQTQKLMS